MAVPRDFTNPQLAPTGIGIGPNPAHGRGQSPFTLSNATFPAQVPTTPRAGGRSLRTRILIGGGAVAVVAAVIAAAVIFIPGGSTDTPAASGGTSAATTSTAAAGQAQDTDADADADTIMAAFPAGLKAAVEKCERSGCTTDQAPEIRCTVNKSNALAAEFPQSGKSFVASVDPKAAKKTLLGYREYDNVGDTTTDNTARTAGVKIRDDSRYVNGTYVNIESGLTLALNGQDSSDGILSILRSVGLLCRLVGRCQVYTRNRSPHVTVPQRVLADQDHRWCWRSGSVCGDLLLVAVSTIVAGSDSDEVRSPGSPYRWGVLSPCWVDLQCHRCWDLTGETSHALKLIYPGDLILRRSP
ncbi:hypothetical protein ACFWNH_02055 [Rhodococcus qingshengii]|uniref:hypothetical protein n=1 Tax=Rhodococcus qingshengii TaxID=334542 RepID=UPI003660407E